MAGTKAGAAKGAATRRKAVNVKEFHDPNAKQAPQARPPWAKYQYHTISIAEQEGEKNYVDLNMSGTRKDPKTGEELPVGPLRLWIQRGVNVANVPLWAVHILMETAVETRFRQEEGTTRDGGKKMKFIPYRRSSYPCSVLESYNVKREDVEDNYQPSYTEPGDLSGGAE